MSNENIKSWPVQLYCRSELGTDYWTAHLTQCNDEIEYIRSDLVEQMQIEAIRAALDAIRREFKIEFDPIAAHFAGHILDRINPATILQSLKEKNEN